MTCGFDRADVIISVGYDMVEYHPNRWHPDAGPADHPHRRLAGRGRRVLRAGRRGGRRHRRRRWTASPHWPSRSEHVPAASLWQAIVERALGTLPTTPAFRSSRSGSCWDLRRALAARRRSWSATSARTKCGWPGCTSAERPNTCIISNGFAAMGIAVPGAIAAKLAFPDRTGRDRHRRRRLHDELARRSKPRCASARRS